MDVYLKRNKDAKIVLKTDWISASHVRDVAKNKILCRHHFFQHKQPQLKNKKIVSFLHVFKEIFLKIMTSTTNFFASSFYLFFFFSIAWVCLSSANAMSLVYVQVTSSYTI